MKIAFIVGSMQVNTNGVAAYTSILSKQLEAMGHNVLIITLNELEAHNTTPNSLNLGKHLSIFKRYFNLRSILLQQKPDLISIQYVPYSFHPKGLAFELLIFSQLLKLFRVHLMVHEPWIETTKQTTTKNKIISFIQKTLLTKIFSVNKPILITSTIPHYVNKLGSGARLMPLFSNIQYCPKVVSPPIAKKVLKCIFFGSFSFDIEGFIRQLNWIKQYCFENDLKPEITLVGDNGIQKNKNIQHIKNILGESNLIDLGWRSSEEISLLLQEQDLGISRATFSLFGKSGSTLAMLEHGLMVLLRGNENIDLSCQLSSNFTNQLIQITDNYNFKMARFEPKLDAVKIHSQLFLRLIDESLLLS